MAKYKVWGRVIGEKYLGEVEAETAAEARELGLELDTIWVSLCSHCSGECTDPEVADVDVELSEDTPKQDTEEVAKAVTEAKHYLRKTAHGTDYISLPFEEEKLLT